MKGTGAQDRDTEAILEIAVVPITDGRPSLDHSYATLIDPGRPVPRRPWISSGLTTETLRDAPSLPDITGELTARLDGRMITGHSIAVDWRLLRRNCPGINPAGLLDTVRLARAIKPAARGNSL